MRTAALCCSFVAAFLISGSRLAYAQECSFADLSLPFEAELVAASSGKLYAAGTQTAVGRRLAVRSEDEWQILPGVFDGQIRAIAATASGVVVGGDFESVDGLGVARVARLEGGSWLPLGAGVDGATSSVRAVAEYAGQIYIGGDFSSVSGVPAPNLARFAGEAWETVGGGVDGLINDFAHYEGDLVIAGEFQSAGGAPLQSVAAWDGVAFAPVGSTPLAAVADLDESNGRLAALASGKLELLTDGDWVQPGRQPIDVVARRVAFYKGGVFVVGRWNSFCGADGPTGECLIRARFAGGQWSQEGTDDGAPNLNLLALARNGDDLYETGSSLKLLRYTDSLSVTSWTPTLFAWYEPLTLRVNAGCADPRLPVSIGVGDLGPVPAVPISASSFEIDFDPSALGRTGEFSIRIEQGETAVVIPNAVEVLPRLGLSTFFLFGFKTVSIQVGAGSDQGVAVVFAGLDLAPQPVDFPGVFSPAVIDPLGAVLVGSGSVNQVFPVVTLEYTLPLTFPPGLTIYNQALVVENVGGEFLSSLTPVESYVSP